MADWKKLLTEVLLADGTIDAGETALVRNELFADGKVDDEEMTFLLDLRKRADRACPEFHACFFAALKAKVLADGTIDSGEAKLLREIIFADGKVDDDEKAFLTDLKASAKSVSEEFEKLLAECVS